MVEVGGQEGAENGDGSPAGKSSPYHGGTREDNIIM